ncbi:hypothetical protein [Actinophytocola gossypii]|uniref:Oxidoreductase n=1 Tax=Actinophytocola gossypii TaxID=2812003 RepID=A0ABT2JEW3_9PSEU|nr:hypothetical protein [Actinophytocola gossypii]MCT2586417.1 hypothetical protein [Actinophytocola gossypii]
MTEEATNGRRLDPFEEQPPEWARSRAVDIVRQVVEFEPGIGGRIRRRGTTPPVLRFADRWIVGEVDLRAVEFPHLLEFVRCRFDTPPDLRQAKLAGVEFTGCHLPGLEGRNLYSDNDVRLIGGTRVHGRVDLTDAEISGSLELTGSRLHNPGGYALHADRLKLDGALLASNLEVDGQLRIPGLRTGGNVNLAGAHLHNPDGFAVDGNGLHVGGNLQCSPSAARRFRCTGLLFIPSATIDSDLSLRGAELTPATEDADGPDRFFDPRATLVADRVQVSGNVDLDQGLESSGTLRIVNARIGGSVRLTRATIDLSDGQEPFAEVPGKAPGPYALRALHLDGTEISGGIDARESRIAGLIRVVDVRARGSVVLDGAILSNRNGDVLEGRRFTTGGNLDVRGVTVFGSIVLPEAVIGANVDLRASRFVNPGRYRRDRSRKPSVDLRVAQIGRDLVCARGEREGQSFSTHGEIRIRRTEVGRMTTFQGAEVGSSLSGTAINAFGLITQDLRLDVAVPPRGRVTLRHARCASLNDNDEFWAATGHIELDDFRYDALAAPIELDDDAQIRRRLRLLRTAMGGSYRPGPYDQFATMLRASGNEEHAAEVLIEKQRWRYAALAEGYRVLSPGVRLWSLLQRAVVGYGYKPMRALTCLAVLLFAGTLVFALMPTPTEANTDDNLVWNPFLYTLDHLVPIVDFGHKNKWHFNSTLQWFSASLIACGWILATTVAAGLTRMLRRSS